MNVRKAYGSVQPRALFAMLRRLGCDSALVGAIQLMFKQSAGTLRMDNDMTPPYKMKAFYKMYQRHPPCWQFSSTRSSDVPIPIRSRWWYQFAAERARAWMASNWAMQMTFCC